MALRIFNPFKLHVAKLVEADLYVVRKLTVFGWMYRDNKDKDGWWITESNVVQYCTFTNPVDAAQATTKRKPFARLYAY